MPTNDDAATVATAAVAVGLKPCAEAAALRPQPAGDVPDHHQRQRPAAGDVVGRRRQVEQHACDEAEDGGLLGPADQGGRDHDEQAEVRDDTVRKEVRGHRREQRHLQHQGHDEEAGRHQPAEGTVHRSLPSASTTERSDAVPDGTTTPTMSRAPKSTNGSITARCEV